MLVRGGKLHTLDRPTHTDRDIMGQRHPKPPKNCPHVLHSRVHTLYCFMIIKIIVCSLLIGNSISDVAGDVVIPFQYVAREQFSV